jgi:hypothetical protein
MTAADADAWLIARRAGMGAGRTIMGVCGSRRSATTGCCGRRRFKAMTVLGDAERLASWAAVCPGQRESGGKRLSGRTRMGNIYLRRVLCQCAWAPTNTRDCFVAGLYR